MISKQCIIAFTLLVAVSSAAANAILAPAHLPLAAPLAPVAPVALHHPAILTAPAVVGHAPVVVGHAPIATSTHIAAPIAAHTISRPVATYSTTHTLLGAPLAAPALLARPALPLAAPLLHAGLPVAAPLAHPALLARPVVPLLKA